jgi:hypothetical protein
VDDSRDWIRLRGEAGEVDDGVKGGKGHSVFLSDVVNVFANYEFKDSSSIKARKS